MFTAERIGTAVVILIGIVLVVLVLIFQFGAIFDQFDPAYREAKATCDSIKIGMTYDAVKAKVGNLFVPGAATYVDAKGNGQAWLVNNVKSVEVACNIRFDHGHVVFAEMMNEGTF
jgi:hypothetical protein